MSPSLSIYLSLVVVFIGKVQATCNCSASVVLAMCICRDLTLSEPRALELICHDDLLDFTFLTALSDEEKQCIQRLDVSGNDIHQVRAYDLLGFFNLKDLSLSLNALDFIEENAFSNLTSLERLNLSDNNINQLPLNFQNLVNLKQLILSQNNFTSFPNLHGVSSNFTTLYLDGNEITTINQSDFEPLKRLTNWIDFDLTENPLICDCQLAWIVNWLAMHPVAKLAFRANCSGPVPEVTNQDVNLLKQEEFSCGIHPTVSVNVMVDSPVPFPTPVEETIRKFIVPSGGNVTLECTAMGIPTPWVQWRFKGDLIELNEQAWFTGHKNLQLTDVHLSLGGLYHCIAQNPTGKTEEIIEIEVWPESDPPRVAACPEMPRVTPKGEFRLPQHNGLEKFFLEQCVKGPLCGVSMEDGTGVFKCATDGAWQVVDIQNCQYSDKSTRDLQCLSVFLVNDSTVEWMAKRLQSSTINKNMNYLQINFALQTLESIMTNSNVLSSKAVELIVYSISQLMAAPELSAGQTQTNYTNRLSQIVHSIANLKINYGDASYMLSIDSPLLLFEVTSALHLSQYVFNKSKQASVHLPADLVSPLELEGSASGQVLADQSYVSSPGSIAYMAQYKSNVLFHHGELEQDACQLDDCHSHDHWESVNAAIISVGTDKVADIQHETTTVSVVFVTVQDAIDPLCVHWDYKAHGGKGGWSCDGCSLKSWINDKATCDCTLLSATYTLLMTNCNGTDSRRCGCRVVNRGMLADIGVVSCYITIVATLMAVIILFFSWLKSGKLSQFLQVKINIGLALACVSAMYIVSVWPHRDNFINTASCKTVSSFLHYFLTVLYLWITADAYVAYKTLFHPVQRKSNGSEKNWDTCMIKATIVCWGVPLLVITVFHIIGETVEATNCYLYGSTVHIDPTLTNGKERTQICWIKNNYVVIGVLAAPAFICSVFSSFIYCYALVRKSKNKDRQSILSSLILVLLLGLSWAFGLLTLSDHIEFSKSTCSSYSVFYYFFGVCQSAAAVCLFTSSCFCNNEVQQAMKATILSLDDHQSSASEAQSDVLSYLSSQQQLQDVQPEKKTKGVRKRKSSGFVMSGDDIPLETLNSMMPFSMHLGKHQVACPNKRESMATENTEGRTMTIATRSMGEGQSVASGFEEDINLEEVKFVDMEKQEKLEIDDDEPEKRDEGRDDDKGVLEKKSIGYDGDESSGDTSDSDNKKIAGLDTDSNIYSSVTQTQVQFRRDGIHFSDIVDSPPTPLVKRLHRDEPNSNLEMTTSMANAVSESAEEHQAIRKGDIDNEESESADKLTDLPPSQDTLARHIRELDDMLSVSQASLQEFEGSLDHKKPMQTTPLRSSHSVPSHTYIVYPPHHRRNRSTRKLTRPGAASFDMPSHDNRTASYIEQRNQEPMVVSEVHMPRRVRPRVGVAVPARYDRSRYGEIYEAPLVRRPQQAYYYQPQYYSPRQQDDYRHYSKPGHPNREFFIPQQQPPISYYERRPPPGYHQRYPQAYPQAYPHHYHPRLSQVVEYRYLSGPLELTDHGLITSHHSLRPAVEQRAPRQSQSTAGSSYRQENLDQLVLFPGTTEETDALEEGLLGEDGTNARGTWYDSYQ